MGGSPERTLREEVLGDRLGGALDWIDDDELLRSLEWVTHIKWLLNQGRALYRNRTSVYGQRSASRGFPLKDSIIGYFYSSAIFLGRALCARRFKDHNLELQYSMRAVEEAMKAYIESRAECEHLREKRFSGSGDMRRQLELASSQFATISESKKLETLMNYRNRSVMGHGIGCPSAAESQGWSDAAKGAVLELEADVIGEEHSRLVSKWLRPINEVTRHSPWDLIAAHCFSNQVKT